MSRWHTQTLRGGFDAPPEEMGDCVRACLTSILGLPIDAIGNHHGDGWFDRYRADLARHGYCIGVLDMKFQAPAGYWIASVPSLNLSPRESDGARAMHVVVARGDELVHDPSTGKRYDDDEWTRAWNDDEIADAWVLAPLDPVELAA